MTTRCSWAQGQPLLMAYHDNEWGQLTRDRHRLFEFLILEGAQAGLSWLSILQRRDGYREAFAEFDPERVGALSRDETEVLLGNPRIIRNRAKVVSAISNAQCFVAVEQEFGGFDHYLDAVTGGPVVNRYNSASDVPVNDQRSQALSADLRRRGFRFVGPTICYSYLEAVGWTMDHVTTCYRFAELSPP